MRFNDLCVKVDTSTKALLPSVWHKYRIRTVFGTNRNSGCFFGKEQPALLLEGDVVKIIKNCSPNNALKIALAKIIKNSLPDLPCVQVMYSDKEMFSN